MTEQSKAVFTRSENEGENDIDSKGSNCRVILYWDQISFGSESEGHLPSEIYFAFAFVISRCEYILTKLHDQDSQIDNARIWLGCGS